MHGHRYLIICQPFCLRTKEVQKDSDDNSKSEKHISNLSTEIACVGVYDVRNGKDDNPSATDLGYSDQCLCM